MKTKLFFFLFLLMSNFVSFSQTESEVRELMRQHRYREAIEILQQFPETRENILMRARSFEELLNFPSAIREYEKLLPDNPDDIDLLLSLAEVTWRAGNADASLSYWTKINELSPDNLFFQTRKTVAHYRASDWQGTIDASQKVFEQDSIPLLLRYVGDAHISLGNAEGMFYYREAIARNPADHISVVKLGNIYYNSAASQPVTELADMFYNLTIEVTEDFLQNINPNHRQVGQLNGMAHYSSGVFDKAIERLKANVELGDSSYTTTYFLGMSYYASRLFYDATIWLEKAYESDNSDINLLYFYGTALIRTVDRDLGIQVLQEGVDKIEKLNERLYDFDLSLADAYLRLNRPSTAIEYYQSALRRRPGESVLLYNIANTFDRMASEKRNALTFYERFMQTAPEDFATNNEVRVFYRLADRRIRELREELFMRGN
jgi:tetratricopeptide (TPR) repeat protein